MNRKVEDDPNAWATSYNCAEHDAKRRCAQSVTYPSPPLPSEWALDVPHFRTFGFVVIRQFFDAPLIAAEID